MQVARGNCFLSINGGPWRSVIYALKKFTGGMGDDDDRQNGGEKQIWQSYFTKVCPVHSTGKFTLLNT